MPRADYDVALLLLNPKYPHNVGGAVRAAAIFCDRPLLIWTGPRVNGPSDEAGFRLPREERLRTYRHVTFEHHHPVLARPAEHTPICVEFDPSAEGLVEFEHPERPLYVFGPEDGSVSKGMRTACHRFVRIPGHTCLNLAAAVNVVLYDRLVKRHAH
jgi:tRNA(Leu) C34 or U34 (ribose-2'-O)-methylase TrmL